MIFFLLIYFNLFQYISIHIFCQKKGKVVGGDFLCAAVSPQGKWVYCVGEDGVCYVFDSSTGQLESVLQVADREVSLNISSLCYSFVSLLDCACV